MPAAFCMRHRPSIFVALLAALLCGCASGSHSASPSAAQFAAANRLPHTLTPLLRHTSQTWNHQGLVASVTDPSNQPTYFYYDGKGRLTNRTDNLGTTLYRFDANDNRTGVSENGLTNSWTFDAYNRVSSYEDVYGNLIQYRFDANGNLTNLVYPGGRNVFYTFDKDNHLTQVKDWSGRTTTMNYDLAGRLTTFTRPNGTFRTLSYDSAGELTNVWEQMANSLPIAWNRFNWNSNSTMQWEFAAPLPHTNAPTSRTMTYNDDNELKTVDGSSVTVDLDGNLISGPLTDDNFTAYTFDVRNRLLNAGGVTNGYDAMNNRIGQAYGTNSIAYIVNPNAKLPQVLLRIKNGVTNYYIYGAGLLYQITETATATNTLTYHYDYRGSTIALSADNGLVTDRMEYSLYGTLTYRVGTNDTPFLFNGRYGVMTDANGLLYMRARYYNPYLCRFLNADPSGFKGGLNFYAYANGNPASYLDPFGLCAGEENASSCWLSPSDLSRSIAYQQIGANTANENEDPLLNAIGFMGNAAQAYQQQQAAQPAWVQQMNQVAQLAVMAMVPEAGVLDASIGSLAADTGAAKLLAPYTDYLPWVGDIRSVTAASDTTMYRVWGGGSQQAGAWLSPVAPTSAAAATESLALPVENTAQFYSEVLVPGGTRYQIGAAAAANGLSGGGVQVQLLERIPLGNYGPGIPLH